MNNQIKSILWATDFSGESLTALAYANYLARRFGAGVKALHVVPDFAPALYETRGVVVAELMEKQEKSREQALKKLQRLSDKNEIKFSKIIVETGSAGRKIAEVAEKEKCQLIAIGRKGLSALEKILLGSVANQVPGAGRAQKKSSAQDRKYPGAHRFFSG